MPKLLVNKSGELYTRYAVGGQIVTTHFNSESHVYFAKKKVGVGDDLPNSWITDTKQYAYKHDEFFVYKDNKKIFNAYCPVCKRKVFYYENEFGSKVYFDCVGEPWTKHPCTISDGNMSKIAKRNYVNLLRLFLEDEVEFVCINSNGKRLGRILSHLDHKTFRDTTISIVSSVMPVVWCGRTENFSFNIKKAISILNSRSGHQKIEMPCGGRALEKDVLVMLEKCCRKKIKNISWPEGI